MAFNSNGVREVMLRHIDRGFRSLYREVHFEVMMRGVRFQHHVFTRPSRGAVRKG